VVYVSTVQDSLHRLLGPLFANWKILGFLLAISFAWSLVRRIRWWRQSTKVNAVANNIGLVPLDKLPIERNELKSFEFPLGLGKPHNILTGSVNGNEVVLFDTEVAHSHGEPTLQTIAGFRLSASTLPDFTLQPKSVVGSVLTRLGKSIDYGDDFSRDYFLTSADGSFARAYFRPEFREFFEGLERYDSKKKWHVQERGVWVIIYRKDEGVEPDDLQTFLEGTAEIVRNLQSASGGTQLT
jgi:hypothetical protein